MCEYNTYDKLLSPFENCKYKMSGTCLMNNNIQHDVNTTIVYNKI